MQKIIFAHANFPENPPPTSEIPRKYIGFKSYAFVIKVSRRKKNSFWDVKFLLYLYSKILLASSRNPCTAHTQGFICSPLYSGLFQSYLKVDHRDWFFCTQTDPTLLEKFGGFRTMYATDDAIAKSMHKKWSKLVGPGNPFLRLQITKILQNHDLILCNSLIVRYIR